MHEGAQGPPPPSLQFGMVCIRNSVNDVSRQKPERVSRVQSGQAQQQCASWLESTGKFDALQFISAVLGAAVVSRLVPTTSL